MAATLSWGEPTLYVKPHTTGGDWSPIPYTPVSGSTDLSTTEGDKTEAKIEGGENEAVRYAKNTYSLAFQLRLAEGRTKPISTADGLTSTLYSLILVPENPAAPSLYIENANVHSADDYDAENGAMITYTFDALKATTGDQIKWGTCTVDETTHKPTSFIELGGSDNILA